MKTLKDELDEYVEIETKKQYHEMIDDKYSNIILWILFPALIFEIIVIGMIESGFGSIFPVQSYKILLVFGTIILCIVCFNIFKKLLTGYFLKKYLFIEFKSKVLINELATQFLKEKHDFVISRIVWLKELSAENFEIKLQEIDKLREKYRY
jgi:hypothetical protein